MKRIATLAVVVIASSYCSRPAVDDTAASGPITVRVEDARLELLENTITVTGSVTPTPGADWTFGAPESGRIVEIPKAEGDAVQPGDLLVRFEIPSLTTAVNASQSDAIQAGARLATAKSAAARLKSLVDRGIAPQRELDDAERELQEAEAAVRQAESSKAAADVAAARAVVRARFAGVVAQRWHNTGDSVVASAADPVMRVIDPTRLEVTAAVPAAQLALVVPGQPAKVFNPTDGSVLTAKVVARPQADGAAASGDVRVSLPVTTPPLAVGAPIQVEITGDSKVNVLTVPSAAIFHDGDTAFVVIAGEDGKAHHKAVKTGIQTRDRTQIVSGLTAGEKVIVSGADPVPDGADISIAK